MQISVSGKQINIGSNLQEYVREHLSKVVAKYFDKAISAEVVFSKQSHHQVDSYHAEIVMNEGTGLGFIKGNDVSDDAYRAFDSALAKIDHRLRRYKDKIKNHHKRKMSEELGYDNSKTIKGVKYVISASKDAILEDEKPEVISEKATSIDTLAVGDAIMKMELANLPALFFRNQATDKLCVVYHRADGNISLVEPSEYNGK